MTPRRSVLSVPASEASKVAKAMALVVDEVVVDLEDAVAPDHKYGAREAVARLRPREIGELAVRVNAVDTQWFQEDLLAVVANEAVDSVVLPKSATAEQVQRVAGDLTEAEKYQGRARPVQIQALIESPIGLGNVREIAAASQRVTSLILGYADLSASLGRRLDASWQFAQDALVLAARIAGVQAIDGPLLSVDADDRLLRVAIEAQANGFDGKWVIHPRQVAPVQRSFTPTEAEIEEASEVIRILQSAARGGRGAVQWRGRMLDEAIAEQSRRLLARVPQR